jgi:hypothetical protein
MIAWIRKKLGLCPHLWAEYERDTFRYIGFDGEVYKRKTVITLRCQKCGNLKNHAVKG